MQGVNTRHKALQMYQCHLWGIQYGDVLFHLDLSLGIVCIDAIRIIDAFLHS